MGGAAKITAIWGWGAAEKVPLYQTILSGMKLWKM